MRRFLEARGLGGTEVEPLAGDASNRIYFRLRPQRGPSLVLALVPAAFDVESYPFLEAAALFRELGARVPRVVEAAGAEGALLVEDLGDRLLQDVVGERGAEAARPLYETAVDLLARLQRGAEGMDPRRFLPLRIAFDARKFQDELRFFRVHCLEGLRGARPSDTDRALLDQCFRDIATELAAQPYALCHRDYHSRNLLALDDRELAVIDFQDARRGPRCYDLASLLNDSYVVLPPGLAASLKDRFAKASGAAVEAEYDLAALQRNLKALGTFGYQIRERSNLVYEPYLAPTLELVRANLERYRRWDRLRRALSRAFPELG